MQKPFSAVAEALRDMARWERHRIELMHWLSACGNCKPPEPADFVGWRRRLGRIEAAATFLDGLRLHHGGALEAVCERCPVRTLAGQLDDGVSTDPVNPMKSLAL